MTIPEFMIQNKTLGTFLAICVYYTGFKISEYLIKKMLKLDQTEEIKELLVKLKLARIKDESLKMLNKPRTGEN